ncbi:MAG: Gluconolactonase, partial [Candidatus Woesebacteria bacterium GW2011_GWC2_31_9]
MKGTETGRPDGMKVDQLGNVYCTGPGGIWIMQPDGKCLGRVMMPEQPANFGWSKIDSMWEVDGVIIYKLIHTK